MAFLSAWYETKMPTEIVDILEKDIAQFDPLLNTSLVRDDIVNKHIRNSKSIWIPTSHWISGWLWYYIQRVNRENFLYDLHTIDGETLQYTQYSVGEFYDWHIDSGLDTCYRPSVYMNSISSYSNENLILQGEYIRKLSFSLQLSGPEDYDGGELQLIDNNNDLFYAPKEKGTLIFFDSRTKHRVRKVKSGLRKSLVGWVIGPRWK